MLKIVVGEGSVQALLRVALIPKVGERITIEEEQILGGATSSVELLAGDTFLLTSQNTIEVEGEGKLPWFGIQNMRSLD